MPEPATTPPPTAPTPLSVRTFKPRRRALSRRRADLLAQLGPRWILAEHGPVLDMRELFADTHARGVVLEIGIGLGEAMIEMARADISLAVIGCDVHTPGIAAGVDHVERHALTHVRLVHGDALEFLDRVRPDALAGIRAFFPDPWPKARHRQRRLVRPDVLDRLVPRLAIGGFVHLATDDDDYAAQMVAVCGADSRLRGGVIDLPPSRAMTRYERKALAAGRRPVDLWYERVR